METGRQDGDQRPQESKNQLTVTIKADPDKLNPVASQLHQILEVQDEPDVPRGAAEGENTSSCIPSLNSSLIPSSVSSSLHSPICSTSPPKSSQKVQGSSSSFLNPVPSFPSSYLCPLSSSSFASSLPPLPSSLCSLSSPSGAAGRKGRVCCGVCGKSFYDKGTNLSLF